MILSYTELAETLFLFCHCFVDCCRLVEISPSLYSQYVLSNHILSTAFYILRYYAHVIHLICIMIQMCTAKISSI